MELLLVSLTYGQKYVFVKTHNLFLLLDGKVSLYPNYNMNIDNPNEGIYYIENIENTDNKYIVSRYYSIILILTIKN